MSSQPPNHGWGPPPHQPPPPPAGRPRPWYRQRWLIVAGCLLGLVEVVGVAASLASPTTPNTTLPTTAAVVAASTSAVTVPPTTTLPPTTLPPTTARPATTHPPTTAAPATRLPATKPPTKTPASNCDPAYPDACLHDGIGDYDCAGGSGNGPNYVAGPIRVLAPRPVRPGQRPRRDRLPALTRRTARARPAGLVRPQPAGVRERNPQNCLRRGLCASAATPLGAAATSADATTAQRPRRGRLRPGGPRGPLADRPC